MAGGTCFLAGSIPLQALLLQCHREASFLRQAGFCHFESGYRPRRKGIAVKSLWNQGKGYLVLVVTGPKPEKFINICIRRNIAVWGVERIAEGTFRVCVRVKDFRKNLRPVVRKAGCRVRIEAKKGALFVLRRYAKRKVLVGGGIALCILAVLLSSLLWSVEIEGGTELDRMRTMSLLEGMGVAPGTFLQKVETKELAETILASQPNLSWVGVRTKGTKLYVTLVGGSFFVPEDSIPDEEPCDIVAEKDAVLQKLVVEQGTAAVKEYITVQAGQILIRGEVDPKDPQTGQVRLVHASGSAMGLVWYSAQAEVELEWVCYEPTGTTAQRKELLLFGLRIPLPGGGRAFSQGSSVTTEQYLTMPDDNRLPLGIRTTTYLETEAVRKMLNKEEAIEKAKLKAMDLLDSKIPDEAEIVSTEFELRESDGKLIVYLSAECLEEIGKEAAKQPAQP